MTAVAVVTKCLCSFITYSSSSSPSSSPTLRSSSLCSSSSPLTAALVSASTPPLHILSRRTATASTLSGSILSTFLFVFNLNPFPSPPPVAEASSTPSADFILLPNSAGVKALDLRVGTGAAAVDGDQVAIHYYGRLAAKQGWRFDSTYDHKDSSGEPIPFIFTLGSGKVISGIEAAVRSMKVGGVRRVIIPPSQGYQNTTQEPIPPNFFDRQRLFTTIFNPTRLANGEGSTLGTLIFDIELVSVRH